MAPIIQSLNSHDPHVSFNGALIYQMIDKKRVILSEKPLDWKTAEKIIAIVQLYFPHIGFSFYDADNWYTCRLDEGIQIEKSIGYQTPKVINRELFFRSAPKKIYKIMLWVLNDKDFLPIQHFLNSLDFGDITMVQSSDKTLEITHKEATKSHGINYILSLNNIPKERVAAFGDGHNDIPMFETVGTPIVMSNASEEIKQYGKYITKPNTENGVSYGIKHFLTT